MGGVDFLDNMVASYRYKEEGLVLALLIFTNFL
jgi:hypothetical protein